MAVWRWGELQKKPGAIVLKTTIAPDWIGLDIRLKTRYWLRGPLANSRFALVLAAGREEKQVLADPLTRELALRALLSASQTVRSLRRWGNK